MRQYKRYMILVVETGASATPMRTDAGDAVNAMVQVQVNQGYQISRTEASANCIMIIMEKWVTE